MKQLFKFITYGLLLLLALIYAAHGAQALSLNDEFRVIIDVVGPLASISTALLILVGLTDLLVAIGILFYNDPAVKPWLFIYASLWPIIPNILKQFGGLPGVEWGEVIAITILSVITYVLWNKNIKRSRNW